MTCKLRRNVRMAVLHLRWPAGGCSGQNFDIWLREDSGPYTCEQILFPCSVATHGTSWNHVSVNHLPKSGQSSHSMYCRPLPPTAFMHSKWRHADFATASKDIMIVMSKLHTWGCQSSMHSSCCFIHRSSGTKHACSFSSPSSSPVIRDYPSKLLCIHGGDRSYGSP
ncbi:hypothetical protein EDD15DRAFT_297396 [Pisolithus albus]|nr:hypothetical protein EDD15DRAFT_297396 [Pisolithus albus]